MPYSDTRFDKKIASFIKNKRFNNYLDIGVGAGKYGKIIRDLFPEANIIGVEPDKSYIKRFNLKKIYNKIVSSKAENYFFKKPNFNTEVCIIGDCIEHLKKSDGIDLINYLLYRSHYIIVVFPSKFLQYSYQNHDLEAHISSWTQSDFLGLDYKFYKDGFINFVVIQGYLGDSDAIGKSQHNFIKKLIVKFFGLKVRNEAFR